MGGGKRWRHGDCLAQRRTAQIGEGQAIMHSQSTERSALLLFVFCCVLDCMRRGQRVARSLVRSRGQLTE